MRLRVCVHTWMRVRVCSEGGH